MKSFLYTLLAEYRMRCFLRRTHHKVAKQYMATMRARDELRAACDEVKS